MKIIIEDKAVKSVRRFYKNVAKKYKYSYSLLNMNKNIDELVFAMSNLKDNGRIPTLNKHRRKNYKEATWRRKGNTIDWYFEYKIEIDNDNNVCLHIYEALHKSQMHESINDDGNIRELYESIMKEVAVIVKRAINEIS